MAATDRTPDSPSVKTLAVLDLIARLRAAPVSGIARTLSIPVATAHRICVELERLSYLQRVPGTRLWTVGHGAVAAAANVMQAATAGAPAVAVLRELAGKVGELSSFALPVRDEVHYVASVESPHELVLSFRAGRKAPLFCTSSGRLFLARQSDAAALRYLQSAARPAFTPFTVTDPGHLMATIREVRGAGYAITEQEFVLHVVGAAVPVTGRDGTFFGAVSIAAPDVRTGRARLEGFVPPLMAAAAQLAEVFAAGAAIAGSKIPATRSH
jgi:DNA-binding IclR family transcriptional regulator